MDARLIGRMVLARWLDYSPDRYERLVDTIKSSPIYRRMAARIEVVPLPAALAERERASSSPARAVARLIPLEVRATRREAHMAAPDVAIAYRHPAWGKEFRVDGRTPIGGDPADPEADWLLRRLRPINTRNRLTHLILLTVAVARATFLRSGAWADLAPLTLTALCRRLAGGGGHVGPAGGGPLPPGLTTLDVSLLSRATRGFMVHLPAAGDILLRCLLPNAQIVLRYRLKALLDAEALELKRGELERPRTDDELRQLVYARWGQAAARRTLAAARQALGIPPWHRRARRPIYPPPGFDFSPSCPLTPDAVAAHAPAGPGMYEIAVGATPAVAPAALAPPPPAPYPNRASPVVYLGRSANVRRRLRAHLRNHEKFGSEIGDGRFIFRFAAVPPTRLRE